MQPAEKLFHFYAVGLTIAASLLAGSVSGQVLMSGGTYSQDFDTLASSGTGNTWTDNVTLPGWYASTNAGGGKFGSVASYNAGTGSSTAGALYSFGASSSTERALGSVASGTPGNFAYGVRFTNDTANARSNITISYTGEQWRQGGNTSTQTLAFFYTVSSSSITNSDAAATLYSWTAFTNLDFKTPTVGASGTALDGNITTNRQVFSNVLLPGVAVLSGQELFLRWYDINDSGNDHGVALDDLTVGFQAVSNSPPSITNQPQDLVVTEGDNATFTVGATGSLPLSYQWHFYGTNLPGATSSVLALTNVSSAQAGTYDVAVTNSAGSTNSQPATLTVIPPPTAAFSILTYNVQGNGETNWTTNAPQVQAIGRQMQYLQPDIITFNEIPRAYTYEMTNWVTAFFPGYYLATNSGTDNYIRSVIASRYPITRSSKWLAGAQLEPWGYTNSNFTRDLFEAQINVPGLPQPLHVFTTHLKSTAGTTYDDASAKRAAEAAAITNFFATNFFVLYPTHPYLLTGDMNESDTDTLAIQRLLSPRVGLHLTDPTNPFTGSINTWSIQEASVTERLDYVMPCTLLASNIASSQVFRTDKLNPAPPNLFSNDSRTASDHLPVRLVVNTLPGTPFRLTSISLSNQVVTLIWESANGQQYRVDASSNLTAWMVLASNLTASGTNYTFSTNASASRRFFRVHRTP